MADVKFQVKVLTVKQSLHQAETSSQESSMSNKDFCNLTNICTKCKLPKAVKAVQGANPGKKGNASTNPKGGGQIFLA